MRFRITFSKTEAMRYTSNLDLNRTWGRIFQRAKLPVAYSQGYNPRPKISLASALPLGFTSEAEILDVWLEQDLQSDEVLEKLQKTLPLGIRIINIEPIEDKSPKTQKLITASEYLLTLPENAPHLDDRIHKLLEQEHIIRERRGKQYDLRPLILAIHVESKINSNRPQITLLLKAQEGATGRPDEVLKELGIDPSYTRIHRKKIHLTSPALN